MSTKVIGREGWVFCTNEEIGCEDRLWNALRCCVDSSGTLKPTHCSTNETTKNCSYQLDESTENRYMNRTFCTFTQRRRLSGCSEVSQRSRCYRCRRLVLSYYFCWRCRCLGGHNTYTKYSTVDVYRQRWGCLMTQTRGMQQQQQQSSMWCWVSVAHGTAGLTR